MRNKTVGVRGPGAEFLLWLAILGVPGAAQAAYPWVQEPGHLSLSLWDRAQIGQQVRLSDGRVAELPEPYQDHAILYHFELGLSKDLSLVVHGHPLGFATVGARHLLYPGPFLAGLSHQLLAEGPIALSFELQYGFAIGRGLGQTTLVSGTLLGERYVFEPIVGTQIIGGELAAGIRWAHGSLALSSGARFFTSARLDPYLYGELRAVLGPGYGLSGELTVRFRQPSNHPITELNLSGYGQAQLIALGGKVSYWLFEFLALGIGLEGIPYGRGIAAAPALLLGVRLEL